MSVDEIDTIISINTIADTLATKANFNQELETSFAMSFLIGFVTL